MAWQHWSGAARKYVVESQLKAVKRLAAANAIELPVTWEHARRAHDVGHPDPFDGLLMAQAEIEPLHFLTVGEELAPYSRMVLAV